MSPQERQQIEALMERLTQAEAENTRARKTIAALLRKGLLAAEDLDEGGGDARDR